MPHPSSVKILYCHCQYAQVVPKPTKEAVLSGLCHSETEFEAVADLCELSARKDPVLQHLASGSVKIAACFPRAVKWLFAAAGAPLDHANTEVVNLRTEAPENALALLHAPLNPNLPSPEDSRTSAERPSP